MNIFKKILKTFVDVQQFHLKLKLLGSIKPKEKVYKVMITKNQMNILEYCGFVGIKKDSDISQLTGIKKPNIK